ncbi:XRE family transcriptional regulator [Roseibacterium sp. SDUM158017]|uniref:XRE family transcriptional regulator n=1 Tax=Roseicyclus salinarum TaxID=3036773 RepID=UPI0024150AFA|nr:XRE family transcriptional regulator [Roseibacterium sp. SDUM158017]MDG4649358.1 XRE family transcriptional regulator [Roseibacterium sp. SDUM158017]
MIDFALMDLQQRIADRYGNFGMTKSSPYPDIRLSKFAMRRVLELKTKKSQREIATEAGFRHPNMLSLIKSGASKVPLDRVPALAGALEADPKYVFLMALEQGGDETTRRAVEEIFKPSRKSLIRSLRRTNWTGSRRSAVRQATAIGQGQIGALSMASDFRMIAA